MIYQPSETIKAFKLKFTKLYNKIPKVIRPHEQAPLIHYYNIVPHVYKNMLEEKLFLV